MGINMGTNLKIKRKFDEELEASFAARKRIDFNKEWAHLERAHILGQFQAVEHLWVHILMIRFSIVHFRIGEFLGQIPRILLAIPGSLSGLAPRGNTGGSDVGIFTPMEIPKDLQGYLEADN